jgi:hypothetical protein
MRTTDNKLKITGIVTLSAALAVVTVAVFEKTMGYHLDGTSPEITGSITVIYHAILQWCGISDIHLSEPEEK